MGTTFLCPALGNFALFLISLPAWATLGALGPMYALPLGWLLRREPVTRWAVLGAALAVAGVVPLGSTRREAPAARPSRGDDFRKKIRISRKKKEMLPKKKKRFSGKKKKKFQKKKKKKKKKK